MNVRYRVEFTQSERDELTALLSGGRHAVRKLKRAQILLAADAGTSDEQISATLKACQELTERSIMLRCRIV
jgi:hypothetical protein